jgi:flavodoxin
MSVILNIVSAFDSKGIKNAQKAFAQLETNTQKATYALKKYGGPAALASIGAITAGLTKAVQAAAEDQKSQEQLKIALENTVGANKLQVASVEDSVTALMYQTATADDVLRPALAKLVRATGDVTQAQKLLKLGLDISAGSGRDLSSVTTALSRAATGNFTTLTRLGIPLDQNAVKAKDLDTVIGDLSASFSGAAKKNAQTFEGQVTTLKIAFGELEETVGMQVIPILSDYAQVLVDLTTDTEGAESATRTWLGRLGSGIKTLALNTPALGTLLRTIGFVNKEVTDQAEYLRRLNSPTSNVTKNIKNLTVATVDETDKTKKSNEAKDKAAAAAKKQADAYAKMKAAAAEAAQVIQDKLNAQLDDATSKLDAAQKSFDDFSRTVGSAVTESFNFGQAQAEAADNVADLKDALDVTGKPLTFLDSLEKQAQKAKNFGVLVNRLIAGGLSEAALTQVLAAGTNSGTLIAEEILGSADGILRTNTLTEAMTALSDQLGKNAATKFYNAGVTAAQSYLAGIQSQLGIAPAAISSGGFSFDFASLAAGISVGGLGTLMADGGIVQRATTITAGEAGPEAIIPLDRLGEFTMAGSGGATVNINVTSADPNAVVQALRTYMRQNGSIPIKTNNAF